MGLHLTDKQKKKIIADRLEGLSIRAIAAKHGVSRYAVECAIKSDPAFCQKMTRKKEQNTKEMLDFLDEQKANAQEFIVMAMEALKDEDKLKRTGAQALATAIGIIIDKFVQTQQTSEGEGVVIVWGRPS